MSILLETYLAAIQENQDHLEYVKDQYRECMRECVTKKVGKNYNSLYSSNRFNQYSILCKNSDCFKLSVLLSSLSGKKKSNDDNY